MISNGQEALRKASSYLGASEGAANRSGAPIVDECQEMYGLLGEPWCAMFVGYSIAFSGASAGYKASAKTIVNPSTAAMYDKASAKGWVRPGNANVRPGDLFIIRGLHVGLIMAVGSGATFQTIEGNHQNGVRSSVRSWRDGWSVISIPDALAPGPAAVVSGYGFDDTRVKLYGGWPTPEARDGQLRKYQTHNPDHWTQAVRVAKDSPYAFRAGPPATYDAYTYGPWLHGTGKEIRDAVMKEWEAKHKGVTARPWKKTYKEA